MGMCVIFIFQLQDEDEIQEIKEEEDNLKFLMSQKVLNFPLVCFLHNHWFLWSSFFYISLLFLIFHGLV